MARPCGLIDARDWASYVAPERETVALTMPPPVLSPEEVKRVLAMATSLKARAMLTLSYGCGLRAGEVARLRAGHAPNRQHRPRVGQADSVA